MSGEFETTPSEEEAIRRSIDAINHRRDVIEAVREQAFIAKAIRVTPKQGADIEAAKVAEEVYHWRGRLLEEAADLLTNLPPIKCTCGTELRP